LERQVVRYTRCPVDADHANAVVKFDNIREAKLFRAQLVRISGAWKIHDIDYGAEEGTPRALFKPEVQRAKDAR